MLLTKRNQRLGMLKSWASHDAALYRSFLKVITSYGYSLHTARILDIGCGANAPMTILFHSSGAKITGIDEYIGYRWGLGFRPSRYLRYLKETDLLTTLRKVAGEIIYDRHYYRALAETVGFPLSEEGIDLRQMKADNLRFEDCSFDIIHSNATWEHLANVDSANREVARALRPGGLVYIEIHLFPSLSGGHDLPWIVPGKTELGNIMPWSHLWDPSWQAPVYLNRLRERDYRRLFEQAPALDIIDWKTEFTEGEELVTDEILRKLPEYTADELTKRSIIVLLRKRPASGTSC